MPAVRDTSTVVRAARLYYEHERSQADVARELGLSRSNVSRILTQARERGIVEILIHDPESPPERDAGLEEQLREHFGIDEAVVISAAHGEGLEQVARAAARVVEDKARQVRSVGISWGQTVQRVVAQMEPVRMRPAPRVLPLVGGLSALDQLTSGDSVLRVLAERLGGMPEPLHAPALVGSSVTCRALRAERSIGAVLDAAAEVELGVVGIGAIGIYSSPHLLEGMELSAEERRTFDAQQAVGDVCGRFVDAAGRPLGPPTSERVLAVTFDQLRTVPALIGVAAGAEKAPGVLGVLRSGILETVVLDVALARSVLSRLG